MKNVINITNLCKKYDDDYIFFNFNYSFKETGFYVLFGPSGCGKTTLLNILYGLTDYSNGRIDLLDKHYDNLVDEENVCQYIAYLTQESYFIDYLTVEDNIKLCSNDTEKINNLLKKFKLDDKLKYFPTDLSGGEKQRLSLMQSLLKNKKIFLLDEPTASLDPINKRIIFELLSQLKNNVLIICSSHDSEIFNYCDDIIYFSNLNNYTKNDNGITTYLETSSKIKNKHLYYYMKKKKDNKTIRNSFLMIIIFVICILLSYFCCNIEDKLVTTIQNKYKVNYLTIYCPTTNNNCNSIFKNKHITEYNYVYSLNTPFSMLDKTQEGFTGNISFETAIVTLPSELENFSLIDKIKIGRYFENTDEIMLGYDLALELSNGNIESLIDKKINILLPDGEYEFNIVGIFDRFNDLDIRYFQAGQNSSENINSKYFINGKYNEKYINDDILGFNEIYNSKIVYYIYIDKFSELYSIYNLYSKNKINDNDIYTNSFPMQYIDFMSHFRTLSLFIYPCVAVTIIIVILFYFQTIVLDISYNIHIISVYKFYGYSLKEIKSGIILSNLRNINKYFGYSILISTILAVILNKLNLYFNFMEYQLFNINFTIVGIMYVLVVLLSIFMSWIVCKQIKDKGWYNLTKNGGDLI